MKFPCDNCQARYQIADEKVGSRTLRMKCRRCGHSILIRGSADAVTGSRSAKVPSRSAAVHPPARADDSQVGRLPRARKGLDDSGVGPLPVRPSALPDEPPPRPLPPSVRPSLSEDEPLLWHVSIHDVPVGPISRDEVAIKIVAGALLPDSLCWREGFDDWLELSEIPELAELLPGPRSEPALSAKPPPLPRRASSIAEPQETFSVLPTDVASIAPSEIPSAASLVSEAPRISADALSGLPGSIPKATALPQDLFDTVGPLSEPPPAADSTLPAFAAAFMPDAGASIPPLGASVLPPPRRAGLTTGTWVGIIVSVLIVGVVALVFGRQWLGASPEGEDRAIAATAPSGVFHADRLNFELPEEATPPPASMVAIATQPSAMAAQRARSRTRAGATMRAFVAAAPQSTMRAPAGTASQSAMRATVSAAPTPMRALTSAERAELERFSASSEASPGAIRGSSPNPGGAESAAEESLRPLGEADIRRVVGQNRPSLQRCYESASRGRLDSPSARLDVDVVVGTAGRVTRATARGQGFGDLASCVERAVRRWRFPRSQGGQTRFPVVFHGS